MFALIPAQDAAGAWNGKIKLTSQVKTADAMPRRNYIAGDVPLTITAAGSARKKKKLTKMLLFTSRRVTRMLFVRLKLGKSLDRSKPVIAPISPSPASNINVSELMNNMLQ